MYVVLLQHKKGTLTYIRCHKQPRVTTSNEVIENSKANESTQLAFRARFNAEEVQNHNWGKTIWLVLRSPQRIEIAAVNAATVMAPRRIESKWSIEEARRKACQ